MTVEANPGPLVTFYDGGALPLASANQNPDQGPSFFVQGTCILDPRQQWTYVPGSQTNSGTVGGTAYVPKAALGWLMSDVVAIDAAPATISAVALAASQTPVAATPLTLVTTSGAGVTVNTSVINNVTGVLATGLWMIDVAPAPLAFGQSGVLGVWDPNTMISRTVAIASVGVDTGATFNVVGFDIYGNPQTENITGGSGATVNGKKGFKWIKSITPAGTLSGSAVTAGFSDIFSLPLRSDSFAYVYGTWNEIVLIVSTFVAADTTNPNTATRGDVRGTIAVPTTASNGTRRLRLTITIPPANITTNTGMFGVQNG